MRIRFVVALVAAASTAAWAQAGPSGTGERPDAGSAGTAGAPGAISPTASDDPDVGFGGPEPAQEQAERAAQVVDERLRRLEQVVEEQRAVVEKSQESLRQLETRLAQEEALSATVQQRTIAAEHEQRVADSGARTAIIQRGLEAISAAEERVNAGSGEIGELISAAVSELESAAGDAGRWGSDAEAGHLTDAAQLLRRVPAMIATRNFQDATVALFAAERRATTALALARTVGTRR